MSKKIKVIAISPLTYGNKIIKSGQEVELEEGSATALERLGHVKFAPAAKETPAIAGKEVES